MGSAALGTIEADRPSIRRPPTMVSPLIKLQNAASESQKNLVLVICILAMSIMCIGLVWQAQVIANQREDIKWLQDLKFGG
jgi:hypothetical protein